MANEDATSDQSTPVPEPKEDRILGGNQPYDMIKGHQAIEFGQQPVDETNIRGYSPEIINLNTSTPPQGGSGVPALKVEAKPSEANTQESEKKQ
jgi:hypothetical protein